MSLFSKRSLAGGEIAPSLQARVDLVKYATGVKTLRNWIVKKSGGVDNRPGTEFDAEVKDSSEAFRLIEFAFNDTDTYAMEFGNQYIRFIRNGSQITVSGVTAWSVATVYAVGNLASSGGVNYYCIAAHSAQAPPNATYWYALTGNIYEIPTPYLEADLFELNVDQSADVITITHPDYQTRELSRYSHTRWILSVITFAPGISAPTGLGITGATGTTDQWVVTAIDQNTFEESLPSASVGANSLASSGSPRTITWTPVSGAGSYNVYKYSNGLYGFVGYAGSAAFTDDGIPADTTDTPPSQRNPFDAVNKYPSTSTYYQQRHLFANTNEKPYQIEGSRSANFKNMTRSNPIQDDDAVSFPLTSRKFAPIRHMIDIGKLLVMTETGEFLIEGDADGVLKPGVPNPRQRSYYGSDRIRPIIIGNTVIFVQARGKVIRDLTFEYEIDRYTGNDLTVFAWHLFEGYTIVDWAFQQTPNSIIWAVRSDGILLSLTYLREHQIWAWAKHDFDGLVETVCCVPEGDEDVLYLGIKRTINSTTKRYIERMSSRYFSDVIDANFLDCSLLYDGRNTNNTHTMTLTGSGWTYTDTLTLTSSASFFTAGDVGNEIHLTGADGTIIRASITAYTSGTVVSVMPNKTVPASMQAVAISNWGKAVDTVTGLGHLEAKRVSVFADRYVVASVNNPSYDAITVSSGEITLSQCYVVIRVGLPITFDIETLDIDTPNGESIADKKQLITEVTAHVESTRGIMIAGVAPDADDDTASPDNGFYEYKARSYEDSYDDPAALITGKIDIKIESTWNSNGRVFIRQIDPLPASISSIMPSGMIPIRG